MNIINAANMNKIASERIELDRESEVSAANLAMKRHHSRMNDLLTKFSKQIEDSAKSGKYEVILRFVPLDNVEFDGMDLTEEGHYLLAEIVKEFLARGFKIQEDPNSSCNDTWSFLVSWADL